MDVAGQEVEHAHRVRRDLPSANTDVGQFPSTPFMSTSQRHHHSSDETRMKVSHFQSTFRSQSGNPSTTTTTALGNIPSASDSTANSNIDSVGTGISTSAGITVITTSSASSSSPMDLDMGQYRWDGNSSSWMTTTYPRTMTMTFMIGSVPTTMTSTTTITTVIEVPTSLPTTSASHVNLPATLVPVLVLLLLLIAVTAGLLLQRRRKRLRPHGYFNSAGEGGTNNVYDVRESGSAPLMAQAVQVQDKEDMDIVPDPFASPIDSHPRNSMTRPHHSTSSSNAPHRNAPSTEIFPEEIKSLLSNGPPEYPLQSYGHPQSTETRSIDSLDDWESTTSILTPVTPFFEHLKAARREGW